MTSVFHESLRLVEILLITKSKTELSKILLENDLSISISVGSKLITICQVQVRMLSRTLAGSGYHVKLSNRGVIEPRTQNKGSSITNPTLTVNPGRHELKRLRIGHGLVL